MTAGLAPEWGPALLGDGDGTGAIVCAVCPHECRLRPGQTGRCGVRRHDARHGFQTATYAVSAAHIDAIERKPLYHVRPGGTVLTIGTPGCSLRCDFCLNHRLSQYGQVSGVRWTGSTADAAAIVEAACAVDSDIAMSYSEPSLAVELALDIAQHALPRGVRLLWKSNGFMTARALDLVSPVLDAVNIDVKAAYDRDHRRITGVSLAPVWNSIARLRSSGVWVEVSTPLVPGAATADAQLRAIASRLASIDRDIPWHVLRFTPDFRMQQECPTAPAALARAVEIGHEAGLRFVYVERALGDAGRATVCPCCGVYAVERDIWQTRSCRIVAGACAECGTLIAGRWGSEE